MRDFLLSIQGHDIQRKYFSLSSWASSQLPAQCMLQLQKTIYKNDNICSEKNLLWPVQISPQRASVVHDKQWKSWHPFPTIFNQKMEIFWIFLSEFGSNPEGLWFFLRAFQYNKSTLLKYKQGSDKDHSLEQSCSNLSSLASYLILRVFIIWYHQDWFQIMTEFQ